MSFRYLNNLITPEKLQYFLELTDCVAGAGKDPHNVFDLSDRLNKSRPMSLCVQAIEQDPNSAAFVASRYVGEPYDLETLLKMPKQSLGWTYATVLKTLGYDPNFYRTPAEFNSDAEYISYRVYRTHDIHHVITGFSLDGLGELGVLSVTAVQTGFPAFLFLDIMSLLITFFSREKLYSEDMELSDKKKTLKFVFDQISAGIDMGQAAKPLFPIKWEEGFERPLDEWREELNISPAIDSPFSWYNHPAIKQAVET
jgi:ubiquinone biosynthesis protein COQ4